MSLAAFMTVAPIHGTSVGGGSSTCHVPYSNMVHPWPHDPGGLRRGLKDCFVDGLVPARFQGIEF